jgi:hypothetical protein
MTKAGQRGSRGMGQPPRGGDQLVQLRALIALKQLNHVRDLRAWRGAVAAGGASALAAILGAICAFGGPSFAFAETSVSGVDRKSRSSAAMAFSPASVNFNEYASPVSSRRRQAPTPAFPFDLAHEASLQKLGCDLLRRGSFQGLRQDEAAIFAL